MTIQPPLRHNRGFTLVEVLVSMLIGLLGILVMFQVLSLWESLKRTTAAGSDAQVAGTVAMYSLERDLREVGMGFGMGVDGGAVPSWNRTIASNAGGVATFPLVPVQIVQGASDTPDQITALYGNSSLFVSTQKFKAATTTSKVIDGSYGGFKVDDWVGACLETGGNCDFRKVTSVATVGQVDHATGSIATGTGFVYNLGPLPQRNVWSVQSGKLYRQNTIFPSTAGALGELVEVADNIIDLQAEYGIDANEDGKIGTADWTVTAPASAADWAKVIAIRVALLSRSQQFEKVDVTTTAPFWAGDAAGHSFAMVDIPTASGDVARWQRYRYRVYEQVIPLRNMVWGGNFK
jgi:type IV pilus assembly protein PilW